MAEGHGSDAGHGAAAADLGGLSIAAGEYRLEVGRPTLPAGEASRFSFTVFGPEGPVREVAEHGGVRMHLIVVRRDLTDYQHLHPTLAPDGSWQTELTLPRAGAYRAYADFERGGDKTVLGTDLFAAGAFTPEQLPAPATVAEIDGYRVELEGHAEAGVDATLRYRITRDGEPVDVEPYLGAGGHLVALRQGDLAYLHVHPLAEQRGEISFAATFPTVAAYRLFLQFKHEGRVQTVPLTMAVRQGH